VSGLFFLSQTGFPPRKGRLSWKILLATGGELVIMAASVK
jgi:hypothetical protein